MKKSILVIDDNQDILFIVRTMLEENGYEVNCASTGPEGLKCVQTLPPDLIILDILMPDMDGMEVLKTIKESPDTSSIPVMILSAKIKSKDIEGGYRAQADYYMTKPFTSAQLINGISLVIG